jgi:hypothetical protein
VLGDGAAKHFGQRAGLVEQARCKYFVLCKPLVNTKWPSSNAPAALNFSDYFFRSHYYQGIAGGSLAAVVLAAQRCHNQASMPPYPNLVSDSALLQETLELLRHSGGRCVTAIADCIQDL